MLEVKKDNFDESLEDIMTSINGKGYQTTENDEEEEKDKKQ